MPQPRSPQTGRPSTRAREIGFGVLKLAAAVFFTWLALRKVDFPRAFAIASGLSPMIALGAIALLALQALLSAWRWMLISRRTDARLPFWPAMRFFMASLFYNQALPSTVPGDAARVWGAARYGGVREATIGVFLDRLLTLLALLLLAIVSLALLARKNGGAVALAPALALGAGLIVIVITVLARRHIGALFPGRAGALIVRLAEAVHRLFTSPQIFGLCAISLAIHALGIATIYLLAVGMGLPLAPLAAFIAVPLVLLAALLPISVNGWGVREGTMVAVLAGFEVGATEAATLSVIFGLFQLALGLTGVFFIWFPNRNGHAKATP